MRLRRPSLSTVVTLLAAGVLLAAVPEAVRDTAEKGRIYLFSREFLEELPRRLQGPGRFRFLLQPAAAMALGIRGGLADARAGRPPYLYGIILSGEHRWDLVRSGLASIRNLVAMGIVLDAAAQLLIYRIVHPVAALVVGPVLICVPYAVSRALANRAARPFLKPRSTEEITR